MNIDVFRSYYELSNEPFGRDIPVDDMYKNQCTAEVLSRLEFTCWKHWFAVLTGECGSGKSTLLRRLTSKLDCNRFKVFYLADSQLTPKHLYNGLLQQMGVEGCFYRGDSKRKLHKELQIMTAMHKLEPVIIVDEAHLLSRETLEEIRFLLNFQMDSESPMALILAGQPELNDKLRGTPYLAIRQRINLKCYLPTYDLSQTRQYIEQHMKHAGASNEIFAESAVSAIYDISAGCARIINKLCLHCLIYGAQHQRSVLDDSVVHLVAKEEL